MNNSVQVLSLEKLLGVLLRSIIPILLCTVLFAGAAGFYYSAMVEKQYSATVSIIVDNRSTIDMTENENSSQKKTNTDITASRMMVDSYIAILNNSSVLTSVASQVNATNSAIAEGQLSALTPSALKSSLSMSGVNDTEILQIKATTTDPQLSVDICYAMVDEAKDVLKRSMNTLTVNSIEGDNILVPTAPVSNNIVSKTIIAGILGFVVSFGIAVIRSMLDVTVKASDDIAGICGYAVIGEVPSMITDQSARSTGAKKLWK